MPEMIDPSANMSLAEATESLRRFVKEGDTLFTITKRGSGSREYIQAFAIVQRGDGRPDIQHLGGYIGRLFGKKVTSNLAVPMNGGGSTLSAEMVMDVAKTLFGDSQALSYREIGLDS